jgi:hypothetical protein
MKSLMLAALVAIGLVLVFGGTGGDSAQQDPTWKQGMQRVDSYLQTGLSPETNAAIQKKAHASADWLSGLEKRVADATN